MEYVCKCCDYKTIYQTNYKKHLGSNKHNANMVVSFVCKHCEKEFKFRQSMYRHMKYTCKKNKDIAKNNIKDEVGDAVKDQFVRLIIKEQKKREELQKQLEQLSEKLDQLKT